MNNVISKVLFALLVIIADNAQGSSAPAAAAGAGAGAQKSKKQSDGCAAQAAACARNDADEKDWEMILDEKQKTAAPVVKPSLDPVEQAHQALAYKVDMNSSALSKDIHDLVDVLQVPELDAKNKIEKYELILKKHLEIFNERAILLTESAFSISAFVLKTVLQKHVKDQTLAQAKKADKLLQQAQEKLEQTQYVNCKEYVKAKEKLDRELLAQYETAACMFDFKSALFSNIFGVRCEFEKTIARPHLLAQQTIEVSLATLQVLKQMQAQQNEQVQSSKIQKAKRRKSF